MLSQSGDLALGAFEWEGAGGKESIPDGLSPDPCAASAFSTGAASTSENKAPSTSPASDRDRLSAQDLASLSALLTALINRQDIRSTDTWRSFASIRENDMDKRTETLERAQWQRKGIADLFDRDDGPESHQQLKSLLKLRKSRSYAGNVADARVEITEQNDETNEETTSALEALSSEVVRAVSPSKSTAEPQAHAVKAVDLPPSESEVPTPRPQTAINADAAMSDAVSALPVDIDATISRAIPGRHLVTKDDFEPIRVLGKGCAGKVS